MYKKGLWTGKSYKEYDENGQLLYEINDKGYETSYLKNNGYGNMIKMSNEEKEELLKRVDTRNFEQQEIEKLSTMKPQAPIFLGGK